MRTGCSKSALACAGERIRCDGWFAYPASVPTEPDTVEEDVLSIGSVLGGPSARAWRESITDLTRRVAEARRGVVSPLNLNVVFHVPGDVLQPEGEYVRTGRYDARSRLLVVQATVPQAVPDDPAKFLRVRLREAVEVAEAWAKGRQLADDLAALRNLVDGLR